MATYHECPEAVRALANLLIERIEMHQVLKTIGLKIDLVFAYGPRDEQEALTGPAIVKNGVPALGLTRKVSLKDRVYWPGIAPSVEVSSGGVSTGKIPTGRFSKIARELSTK